MDWHLEWKVGHSRLSRHPSLCLPFCPGGGKPWRDGGVEVSLLYSFDKVVMLFLVGNYYSGCLCGSQMLLSDLMDEELPSNGPLDIGSPWDLAASSSSLICVPTLAAWDHVQNPSDN